MIGFLPTFTGHIAGEDTDAACMRAVLSYYPRGYTFLRDVRRLEGATVVRARNASEAPKTDSQPLLLNALANQVGQPFSQSVARTKYLETLSTYLEESRLFYDLPMRLGLTGGRDSRLLLSGLIELRAHKDIDFFTIAAMSQDVELASSLADKCSKIGSPISWRIINSPAEQYSNCNDPAALDLISGLKAINDENPLLARLLWHFHHCNGQVMPGTYYRQPRPPLIGMRGDHQKFLNITGHSGEILRAPNYNTEAIDNGIFATIDRTLRLRFGLRRKRMLFTHHPKRLSEIDLQQYAQNQNRPFTRQASIAAASQWLGYLVEAKGAGITDFRMFDYFAIAAQQSRRITSARSTDTTSPLATPEIMNIAFQLSPELRSRNEFHRHITAHLCQPLLDIPYSFELEVDGSEVRRDNSRFPMLINETEGVSGFAGLLAQTDAWSDSYRRRAISAIYISGARQVNDYQKDRVACQLAWRIAGQHYVDLLASQIAGT